MRRKTNLGRYPAQASADAGYCSESNLEALETRDIDGYVATGRARDAVDGKGETAAVPGAPELGSASDLLVRVRPDAIDGRRPE